MTAHQIEPNSSARSCTPPTAAEVLGVPFIPPGAVAMGGTRVRAALARAQAAMAPPPLRILEGLFGMLDHRVLVELCAIGVPDALTRPTTVTDLSERVGAEVDMLERMLRFAATRGWVKIDRRGRVKPTKVTAFLRTDHPGGWRAWVEFAGGHEVVAAVGAMSVRQGRSDGFARVNGAPFFEWMAAHPDRWATFDQAMAAGGRMHALALVAALDWSATRSVCDVGGGTGELLACLLDLLPEASGTVLDLPGVVGRSVEHPRLAAVGGDAFNEVPSGFDTYLLVNVLHDWGDEDAGRILGRIVDAADVQSRVIVVDNDRPTVPLPDVAVGADVLMAALTAGGLERGPTEFARLGEAYGMSHDRSVRLASGDFAHVFLMTDRNVVPADTTRGRSDSGRRGEVVGMAWLAPDFVHPTRVELPTGHHLRPIRASDVDIDYPAVMGSRETLWAKYGEPWGWPPSTMTFEQDRDDLARHEQEIAAHETFNYAVLDADETELLGCVYIDPPSDGSPAGTDAISSWWVVDRHVGGALDTALTEFIPRWLADVWGFDSVVIDP